MNLNIRTGLLIFLFSLPLTVTGQETVVEEGPAVEKDDHYAYFQFAAYQPLSFGNSFASEGLSAALGVDVHFLTNLFDSPVLIGVFYNQFRSEVTKPELIGNYIQSDISNFGIQLGYQAINHNKWRGTVTAGLGSVAYNNDGAGFSFKDSGTSLQITPSLSYHFTKNIGIFTAIAYRRDFLNIQAPEDFGNFFDSANYLIISLGSRILF